MKLFSRRVSILAASATLVTVLFAVLPLVRPKIILVTDSPGNALSLPPAPEGFALVRERAEREQSSPGNKKTPAVRIDAITVTSRDKIPDTVKGASPRFFLISRDYLVTVMPPLAFSGQVDSSVPPVRKPLSALLPGEYAASENPAGPDSAKQKASYIDDSEYPDIIFRYARCQFPRNGISARLEKRLEVWLEQAFPEPASDDVAFIGAVGDIMPGRGVEAILKSAEGGAGSSSGVERVFTDTLKVLRSNDVMIGNLEGAVTDGSAKAAKSYTFKYDPEILPFLGEAGFTYLMLTNNHSFDYGLEGFVDTLASVRAAGFATSGSGENLAEASRFWRTRAGGERISVLSCGAYPVEQTGFDGKKTAQATETRAGILWESPVLAELVKREKETGAFVIVCVHGGEEYRTVPSARQKAFYRSLCEAGADVVFGSHPHVLQPMEECGISLIVYSLGNFLFPGMQDMAGAEDSMIVRLGILRGRIVYREIYGARLSGKTVALSKR